MMIATVVNSLARFGLAVLEGVDLKRRTERESAILAKSALFAKITIYCAGFRQ